MNLFASTMVKTTPFIEKVSRDNPDITFQPGPQEFWSPRTATITYNPDQPDRDLRYSILHELAHARLDHTNYASDFELLKLESLAWEEAARLGRRYRVQISQDHIQNCLDTYRDWLHRRSTCPTCQANGLQKDARTYQCINCGRSWRVSSGRFSRPYRRSA